MRKIDLSEMPPKWFVNIDDSMAERGVMGAWWSGRFLVATRLPDGRTLLMDQGRGWHPRSGYKYFFR